MKLGLVERKVVALYRQEIEHNTRQKTGHA